MSNPFTSSKHKPEHTSHQLKTQNPIPQPPEISSKHNNLPTARNIKQQPIHISKPKS